MRILSKRAGKGGVLAVLGLCAGIFSATTLHAAGPEGVWLTQPDHKGQTAHVVSTRCGAAYCGTITRVFDTKGNPVAAPTIGQRVFWDMKGDGNTYAGRAYVPAHKREYAAKMRIDGNLMTVKGCLGPVCQSQTWRRVP